MLRPAIINMLVALSSLSAAIPVGSDTLGSKHTLYLMTCTTKGLLDCPTIILCDQLAASASLFTAVAYYANGPVTSSLNSRPTSLTTVTNPAQAWEGVIRSATVSRTSIFSSNITSEANKLPKGQIAGDAKLDSEDFVCFRDGQTTISGDNDLGLEHWECTANYYCPSIAV